jgi:hypothetical protein
MVTIDENGNGGYMQHGSEHVVDVLDFRILLPIDHPDVVAWIAGGNQPYPLWQFPAWMSPHLGGRTFP